MDFLLSNIVNFWVCGATLLIIIEILLGWSCLIFFIAGAAAMLVAVTLFFGAVLASDLFGQSLWFLLYFSLSAICYWIVDRYLLNNNNNDYQNMVGQVAHVITDALQKGEIGRIKWSGTICKAMLHPDANEDVMNVGDKVIILDIKNNILIVKKNF